MAVSLSALHAGRSLHPPPEDAWYLFLLEAESTQGLQRCWNSNDLIGNRTHNFPAFSIVP
jgi:hypothetical protein